MPEFATHWLAYLALIGAGLAFLPAWRTHALTLGIVGLGGLVLPSEAAGWLAGLGATALFLQFAWLWLTGNWTTWLAWIFGTATLAGLGGLLLPAGSTGLIEAYGVIRTLELGLEWPWLLGLSIVGVGLIAWVILLSRQSLAALGPTRRFVAVAVRCTLVAVVLLALAEPRLRQANDNLTVLLLIDRSLSIPQEIDPNAPADESEERKDLRWRRIKEFVYEAVAKRGSGHERDRAGVILFGRRPRLILPPSDAPRLTRGDSRTGPLDEPTDLDVTYTDISAAIKLALASFPEGTSRRIVLLSDGNENLGNAIEQARLAKQNNVQIDVVPLAEGYSVENEVLVQSVETPGISAQGQRLPIRVLLRNAHPSNLVRGLLTLRQSAEGESILLPILPGRGVLSGTDQAGPALVELRPGLNSLSFRTQGGQEGKSYSYQATFQPLESRDANGRIRKGLPGDRAQNNTANAHVVALGRRRVLFVEPTDKAGQQNLLIRTLRGPAERPKFEVAVVTAARLPESKADLSVFLSNFDCVILANVPAEQLSEDQQEVIRANTYDQGCGLVMVGGPESYGAGGYSGTAVEKALPVDCDIKSLQVTGKGGLVLLMHASEMAEGNFWQKRIAELAIRKLSPVDMVGVLQYDGFNMAWHVPFQQVADKKNRLIGEVRKMTPGDMPDFDPALKRSADQLLDPKHGLASKLCIIISDGDPQLGPAGNAELTRLKTGGAVCTTVGVATHGAPEDQKMQQIATATGGRYYKVTNPNQLPGIYIRETRLISQSYIHEERFSPRVIAPSGPVEKITETPPLYGFVRTTLKPSTLAQSAIEFPTPLEDPDQRFPILAYWQYGLGRAVAFTSDARSQPQSPKQGWDRDWASSEMYLRFWEQVVGWAIRGIESGRLSLVSEFRDGKIRVIVAARDERNRPMIGLEMRGAVTPPNAKPGAMPIELRFEQKESGQYEAEFKADETGSYFVTAQARRQVAVKGPDGQIVMRDETDSIRAGVTLPYSPEFADLESNPALLRRIAEITGGQVFPELSESGASNLAKVAASGEVFRPAPTSVRSRQPIWYWLIVLAGFGMLLDVAIRRISLEPSEVREALAAWWRRLRRVRETQGEGPRMMDRLRQVKAETVERTQQRARRFEASGDEPIRDIPQAAAGSGAPPAPPPATPVNPPPPPTESAADRFARLREAKRKAQEGRFKPKSPDDPPESS